MEGGTHEGNDRSVAFVRVFYPFERDVFEFLHFGWCPFHIDILKLPYTTLMEGLHGTGYADGLDAGGERLVAYDTKGVGQDDRGESGAAIEGIVTHLAQCRRHGDIVEVGPAEQGFVCNLGQTERQVEFFEMKESVELITAQDIVLSDEVGILVHILQIGTVAGKDGGIEQVEHPHIEPGFA